MFDNVESAQRAIEEVNGFDLLGKPMSLDFAKTRSDATVLLEGGSDELEVHKRKRLAEKGEPVQTILSNGSMLLTLYRPSRAKTSPRSSRSTEETQASRRCRTCTSGGWKTGKGSSWNWPQAFHRSSCRSCPRRIPTPEQDPLFTRVARRCRL